MRDAASRHYSAAISIFMALIIPLFVQVPINVQLSWLQWTARIYSGLLAWWLHFSQRYPQTGAELSFHLPCSLVVGHCVGPKR